jgi:quinol monooxygenase YgiN
MKGEVPMSTTIAVSRRGAMQGLFAVLASAACAPAGEATSAGVVRISRARFAPESYDDVRDRLDAAQATLIPAIRELAGCIHYVAAIDRESSSMVNVSVWRSLADAQQMQSLAPMQALAEEFTRAGVVFERPIVNYETVWELRG